MRNELTKMFPKEIQKNSDLFESFICKNPKRDTVFQTSSSGSDLFKTSKEKSNNKLENSSTSKIFNPKPIQYSFNQSSNFIQKSELNTLFIDKRNLSVSNEKNFSSKSNERKTFNEFSRFEPANYTVSNDKNAFSSSNNKKNTSGVIKVESSIKPNKLTSNTKNVKNYYGTTAKKNANYEVKEYIVSIIENYAREVKN